MRRGTTPTLTCNVDFDFRGCDKVLLTIDWIGGELNIEKQDLQITENTVSVTLTQEQTLSMPTVGNVRVQLRGVENGNAVASSIASVSILEILNEEVI